MKQLGDVTKLDGSQIEPVSVITFGSPCQDLSIAGRRAGLQGERSGLFLEAVRIIKEMREATNGVYPAFAVWENVPGAFSSNKGEDFRQVLQELARLCDNTVSIPRPPKSGSTLAPLWETAGQLPGVSWTPNTGECPSAAVESRLSWILEAIAPPKYYLTPKACNGILRRAERRGKPLPESLESALRYQAEHYAEIIERVKELWERYAA